MALPELCSSFGARLERVLDGVPGLVSYLVFTSLLRRAPTVARAVELLARRHRGRAWLVGEARSDAGAVRLAYLGSPDRLSRWLLDRLGAGPLREEDGAGAPGSVACDVELRLVPSEEADDWAGTGWLVLPRYVHHRQRLDREPSTFERRVARRARASGVSLRFTRDARDLDLFKSVLYDPMLERRHGERALRTGRALLRFGQLRGGLFVAEHEGRPVAGAVAAPSAYNPAELEIWALGVAGDAPAGAGPAAILGWIDRARERRLSVVDHVASLPLYSDGLTRQKLRWGTTLHEPFAAREMLALRVQGSGPAIHDWLSRHCFAARSRAGIVRVAAARPDELARVARSLAVG